MEIQQKWMDNLVIVRHSESQRNTDKTLAEAGGLYEYGGNTRDMASPLTERGLEQAVATGKYLASNFRFDRVFTSPYIRTTTTAETIVKQFDYNPTITHEERLREKDFGIFDGLTKAGIQKKYTDEWKRRDRDGKYYYRPPGGENYPDVVLRIHSFLGTLTRDYQKQSVLLVCHSVIVLVFRRLLERLTEEELMAIDRDPDQEVQNCSVTWYSFDSKSGDSGKMILRDFNRVYYPKIS